MPASTGIAALVMVAGALGFGFGSRRSLAETIHREAEEFEEDEERTSISLGWMVHTFLSLKARLWLFITRRMAARSEDRRGARTRDRVEPGMTRAPPRDRRSGTTKKTTRNTRTRTTSPRRAPRKAAPQKAAAGRRFSSSGFVLPPLNAA